MNKRKVITRSGTRTRPYFTSLKCDHPIPCESFNEWDGYLVLEFDRSVTSFSEYQEEVVVDDDVGRFSAFPDAQVTYDTGVWGLIEWKDDHEATRPETANRLDRLARQLRREDTPYLLILGSEIHRQPRHSILRDLVHFRRGFLRDQLAACPTYLELRNLAPSLTLGELSERLGGWDQIRLFIANGLLEFDPERRWTRDDPAIAI